MSSSFGHIFRVTTFGESHGGGVGVVIDGCPPRHQICLEQVQKWLDRRRPGQSHLASPRQELDQVECLSGLHGGLTLGTPITLIVRNKDAKKEHYQDLTRVYRPSHADYTTEAKYGIRAASGGGRASARETIGRVAAAAVAEQVLASLCPQFRCVGFVETVKDMNADISKPWLVDRETVDQTPLRCPGSPSQQKAMEDIILRAKKSGDSVGGIIYCILKSPPVGLGAPIFDKLEADLAKAMMSLPATKAFEIGSGFEGTKKFGSEHNDAFVMKKGKVSTETNLSGGIQGGISNGESIYFRVGFKPVATIFKEQKSVDANKNEVTMKPKAGRHDPCVLPRAVPMVEAMAILVILDHYLRQQAILSTTGR